MRILSFCFCLSFLCRAFCAPAESTARPGLFFREDWKEIPPAQPVTQAHVVNSDLILSLHGPGQLGVRKSHHDRPLDDPYYIWSGECRGTWAVSLRHRNQIVDLTGQAKLKWRTKQAGFRRLHIILKLANSTWLVSDQADDASKDWREREFNLADIHWRRLDIDKVIEGEWFENPDLSRVEEIGFTDLMPGGGSSACSRLDWIEVFGRGLSHPTASAADSFEEWVRIVEESLQ